MKLQNILLIGVAVAVLGTTGFALPFNSGDVLVGSSGTITHYNSAGSYLEDLLTGTFTTNAGMSFNNDGSILYATDFQNSAMRRFSSVNGSIIPPDPWLSNDANSHNESVVVDATGNLYVGQADGTKDILKLAPDGSLLARYDVAINGRGTDWLDLSADQTTMFYTGEGRIIKRYDVGLGIQLSDFATLPGGGNAFALRLLADGGLLVSDRSNIKRLNSLGIVTKIYDAAGEDTFFALSLDPNGEDFWTASGLNGDVFRFDIATGLLEKKFHVGNRVLSGLAIKGELTQGTLPEPSTVSLLILGLCGLEARRRRRE